VLSDKLKYNMMLFIQARDSYDEQLLVELQSDTVENMESNVERIVEWVENYSNNAQQANSNR